MGLKVKNITVSGWKIGFEKVAFTKLLRYELGYSLKTAKDTTDTILDGQSISIEVSEEEYQGLIRRIEALGANIGSDG
jgi:ribosomal protein L7/L12